MLRGATVRQPPPRGGGFASVHWSPTASKCYRWGLELVSGYGDLRGFERRPPVGTGHRSRRHRCRRADCAVLVAPAGRLGEDALRAGSFLKTRCVMVRLQLLATSSAGGLGPCRQ